MKTLLVVFLLAALVLDAAAEPCGRAAWMQETRAPTPVADTNPPAWVDPGLKGKTVKVYFRDGRLYEGKLVEVTDEVLRLKMGKHIETIRLTEVARVERKPRRAWLPFAVAGVAVGVTFAIVAIAVAAQEPD
jgi:hypothetical protein